MSNLFIKNIPLWEFPIYQYWFPRQGKRYGWDPTEAETRELFEFASCNDGMKSERLSLRMSAAMGLQAGSPHFQLASMICRRIVKNSATTEFSYRLAHRSIGMSKQGQSGLKAPSNHLCESNHQSTVRMGTPLRMDSVC